MAIQSFRVIAAGKEAQVEIDWSRWSYAGQIRVDGHIVKRWDKGKWVPKEVPFEINGEKALIKRTGWFVEKWILFLNDERYH
jgi:hypothetical protein